MSVPWPTQAWPNTPPPQALTLDQALLKWEAAKVALSAAKETEMDARKAAFALGFGADAQEGTNTLELNNGYELKGVKKLNYRLSKPDGFAGSLEEAVDNCVAIMPAISNEGAFIADRLFVWTVELAVSEYKALVEDAKSNPTKKRLLEEVNHVVTITEGAPTLAIKEPPKRGRK